MELTNKDLRGTSLAGANLSGVDLRGVNLSGVNLKGACLSDANLRGANLSEANLEGADLSGVDLHWANLRGVNLEHANLAEANLKGACLSEANLHWAKLYGVNLTRTILRDANLAEANLEGADLSGAFLAGADLEKSNIDGCNLRNADLNKVKNMPFIPFACPDTGSFIGYKKALDYIGKKFYIVKLQILDDSKRSSATTSKCRCDKAKVLAIENVDGSAVQVSRVISCYDTNFEYEVGKIVQAYNYDENRWHECSGGIHFFVNRDEAVDYVI